MRKWFWIGLIAILVCLIDQVTKSEAVRLLQVRDGASHVWLDIPGPGGGSDSQPLFRGAFTLVFNAGAAWGLLRDTRRAIRRPFFMGASLVGIGFLAFLAAGIREDQSTLLIAFALMIGGAVGNFADRIRFDHVIDFIDLHVFCFRWWTFNLADLAITSGLLVLILHARHHWSGEETPSSTLV